MERGEKYRCGCGAEILVLTTCTCGDKQSMICTCGMEMEPSDTGNTDVSETQGQDVRII